MTETNKEVKKPRCIAHVYHGGSTKGAGTIGAAVYASENGLPPDVIIAVSFGSIAAVLMAMGMHDEALRFSREVNIKDWFDSPPMSKNGSLSWSAVWRIVRSLFGMIWAYFFGRHKGAKPIYSLGVQNTQRGLSKIVTEEIFDKYKAGDYPPCYIVSVNYRRTQLVVRNAKELSYQDYLDAVDCSAQLLLSGTGGSVAGGELEVDGGYWSQNPSHWLLTHPDWSERLTDMVSIYMTPDNNELPLRPVPTSIGAAALGGMDLMQQANYIKEERRERELCDALDVYLYEPRLPLILREKYDTDMERLEYLQRMGALEMRREIERRTEPPFINIEIEGFKE